MAAVPLEHRTALRLPEPSAPSPRPDDQGRRPDLRVVAPRRTWGRYLLAMFVVLVGGIFGRLSLDGLAAESSFEAQRLQAEVDALSVRSDELTAQVSALESPEHVRRVAQELGMVAAREPAYLFSPSQPPAGPGGTTTSSSDSG